MKRSIAAAGVVVALVAFVSAGAAWANWTDLTNVTITKIEIDSQASAPNGTTTYLSFNPPNPGTAGNRPTCATAGRPNTDDQAEMTGSADNIRAMTSLATAAYLAGRPVKVYWTGGCDGNYALFNMIQVL